MHSSADGLRAQIRWFSRWEVFAAFFDGFRSEFRKPGDRVEGGAQIAIIHADGSGFQELTSGADNNAFPSYSPDGHRLVFGPSPRTARACAS
jgi:Tol biopolymer transport system component